MNNEIHTFENHAQDSRVQDIGDVSPLLGASNANSAGVSGNNPLVVYSKASHARNAAGDGERYEKSEVAQTRNTFDQGETRAQEVVVSSAVAVRTANTHANGHGVAEEATHTLDRASGQAVAVGFKAGQSANGGLGIEEEVCPTQSHQPSALEPTVAIGCDRRNQSGADEVQPALQSTVSDGGSTVAVGVDAYNQTLTGGVSMTNTAKNADPHHVPCVSLNHIVRRLTPVECERLQGFPDGWTRIPYRGKPAEQCPDSPRYKALGNSWGTNCAEWILRRIVAAFRLDMIEEASE